MSMWTAGLLLSVVWGVFSTTSFLTIGDWGGVNLGGYHEADQKAVAKQMGVSAAESKIQFIINVGDNFYYNGVNSTSDPLWKTDYEDIFTAPALQVPWYSVLGNHDYGLNPESQTQYTRDKRWIMPARYYTKRIQLSATHNVSATFVFLDTNPCIKAYRDSSPSGWDPNTPLFHKNILAQQCGPQATWWAKVLSEAPKEDWLIVVGHHPADEVDVNDPIPLFTNIDMYLCGHAHTLELFQVDSAPTPYVISGAGCMVRLDEGDKRVKRPQGGSGHQYKSIWEEKKAGFTIHTFNEDFTSMTTKYIEYTGTVLHSFVTNKRS